MFGNRRANTLAAALAVFCSVLFAISSVSAKQAKPQGLWVGGENFFSEFQGKALLKSGTPKPHLAFGSTVFSAPFSMAFDRRQDLWTVFDSFDTPHSPVVEITHGDFASLTSGGRARAKLILIRQSVSAANPFVTPNSLDFGAAGDLWVVDDATRVVELLADQLKRSGTQTAAVTITSQVATPSYLRFDRSNNLWVVEFPVPFDPSKAMIWRYSPSDRAAGASATPSLIVNLPDQIPALFGAFAFDGAGNLWISASGSQGDEIEMISASDLSGNGVVTPTQGTVITSPSFTPNNNGSCFGGMDFDRLGNLWVSASEITFGCDNAVVEFSGDQLSAGGNLTPSVVIGQNGKETNLFLPGPIKFGPTAP